MPDHIRQKLRQLREETARMAKEAERKRRANYWRAVLGFDTYHSTAK